MAAAVLLHGRGIAAGAHSLFDKAARTGVFNYYWLMK
jgi:hypothetical protein